MVDWLAFLSFKFKYLATLWKVDTQCKHYISVTFLLSRLTFPR